VTLTNNTDVLYAEESTQIGNVIALTASLSDTLSARVSLDVRHDTNPPLGFEDTDTTTKVAIVYGFGK
jgi:putative salt-induced outer membrane protein